MSVESKVKELLEKVTAKASSLDEAMGQPMQGSSQNAPHAGAQTPTKAKDSSIKSANSGDSSMPRQGDSQDASYEERDGADDNQGAITAKGISKNTIAAKGPVGQAINFTTTKDLNQIPQNTGNYMQHANEDTEEDENLEVVSEEDQIEDEETTETVVEPIDLSPIFGEDLSEDFREKATSIFEAAVIARVNNEMEKVSAALEEKYAEEFTEYKEGVVEKIDAYLNYVVENYLEENKLAVESGLRSEIAEDFMSGLKALFKEHYIEVPEEKYDVISELQSKVTELEEGLNSQLENNVNLNTEVTDLRKKLIIKEMSKDLADTEANKLAKLLEGVEFDNADFYKEKVSVIKENYFPRDAIVSKETAKQALLEETAPTEVYSGNDVVSTYAQALSRTIKRA
jgi:regulator of replication initiation timing